MKTIEQVLAEANLSEAQVGQIASLVEEARAETKADLRKLHIEEMTDLEKSKDGMIAVLMQDLVEAKKASKPVMEVGCTVMKAGDDKTRYTVTEVTNGSAVRMKDQDGAESDADMKDLTICESDPVADKKAVDDAVEEAVKQTWAKAATLVEAEMKKVEPLLREARAYQSVRTTLNTIQESLGAHYSATLVAPVTTQVDESNELKDLRAQVFTLQCNEVFREKTEGLAESTKQRVSSLVDVASPSSLQQYTDLVEVAVSAVVKPSAEQKKQGEAELNENRQPKKPTPMDQYLAKI